MFFHITDTLALSRSLPFNECVLCYHDAYLYYDKRSNGSYQASMIDGANEFQNLARIVVPMSKPIIGTIGLMSAIAYWNNWTNGIYFIQSRRNLYGIQNYLNSVISNVAFLQTHSVGSGIVTDLPSISIRMALAVIAIIPVLVAYPFFQKSFVAGITVGSVKG